MNRLMLRKKLFLFNTLTAARSFRTQLHPSISWKTRATFSRFNTVRINSRFLSTAPASAVDDDSDDYDILMSADNYEDYYDRPRYPVVAEEPDYLEETRHLHTLANNKVYEEVIFDKVFERKSYLNIHEVQHAQYININDETIRKYFPEGFAGEAAAEFDHAARASWMVRPATKFICRLIENFDKRETANSITGDRWRPSQVEKVPFHYSGVTDRGEWPQTATSVRYYSKEVAVKPEGAKGVVDGVLPGMEFVGSDIENWLNKIDELSTKDKKGFPDKILISGTRGVGKSMLLNQAVLHARSRGWLCFFVPSGWDYCQSGEYVIPVKYNEDESVAVFDNPQMSAAVLRGFYRAHKDVLSKIPIRDPAGVYAKYISVVEEFNNEWNRMKNIPGRENLPFLTMREMIEGEEDNNTLQDELDAVVLDNFNWLQFEMKTLADLAIFGVAFRQFAGTVAMDLIEELKEVTSVPVLFAIDQWNQFEVKTAFAYEDVDVIGKQLCIPHALQFLSKKKSDSNIWNAKNAMCIASLSYKHCEGAANRVNYDKEQRSVPLMIRVPVYDSKEFLSAITYYQSRRMLALSATTQDILAYRTMTGSNPWLTRRDTADYWLPVECDKMEGNIDDPDFFLGDEEHPYPNRTVLAEDDDDAPEYRREDRDSRMRNVLDDALRFGGGESTKSRRNLARRAKNDGDDE